MAFTPHMKWSFLVGCFYLFHSFSLQEVAKCIQKMECICFACWIPNLDSSNLLTTGNLYIGGLFNWYIKKNYLSWWRKYNYILYAALNTGVAWAQIIVFFATSYNHIATVNWWGNYVFTGRWRLLVLIIMESP